MDVLKELSLFYCGFNGEKGSIGKSFFGKDIKYFAVRKTDRPKIIFQYAIHAREYITTYLAFKQINDFVRNGARGTVYFVPATNPDGIRIALTKNPLWKANGRGVDLNVNFDARWGSGAKNVFEAGAENCAGEKPFSERESVALRDFTLAVKPDMTVSYHSKGQEIYWYFSQDKEKIRRDRNIAEAVSAVTGYPLKFTPYSAGGYKDWCIDALKIPSITVEVGNDCLSHPLKKKCLADIYNENKNVVSLLTEILK